MKICSRSQSFFFFVFFSSAAPNIYVYYGNVWVCGPHGPTPQRRREQWAAHIVLWMVCPCPCVRMCMHANGALGNNQTINIPLSVACDCLVWPFDIDAAAAAAAVVVLCCCHYHCWPYFDFHRSQYWNNFSVVAFSMCVAIFKTFSHHFESNPSLALALSSLSISIVIVISININTKTAAQKYFFLLKPISSHRIL